MPITTNFHFVYFADVLSSWATERMRELYGSKFPNKSRQIHLERELSDLVEKRYSFLPEMTFRILLNRKTEIPLCYVEVKE